MIWVRVVVVAAVVIGTWLAMRWHDRRTTVTSVSPRGLTVVTAEGCVLCGPALDALRREEPGVPIRVIDASEMMGRVGSVPTALVVDADGAVLMQRSGRSVITDAGLLVAAADAQMGAVAD